jgi:RNA polymerase sigma-70 factor (ECF subfamily)
MSEITPLTAALREAHTRFAGVVEPIRPDLHRYCSRMAGSALDGEDLVQETLAQAYYGLSLLREDVPLRPWLFKIAHHKCVDFLRSRSAWPTVEVDERNEPTVEIGPEIEDHELALRAFSTLVLALPPRERACVLLKDVLGYSLPEIAGILDTSVGGVKAALHRGREKLTGLQEEPAHRHGPLPEVARRYIDIFNRRDWAALGALLEEDVHCELVGHVHHVGREALQKQYFSTYASLSFGWRLVEATIDGEPAILCEREEGGRWAPWHPIRLDWRGGRVARIRDYVHVSYLLRDKQTVIDTSAPSAPSPRRG